MAKAVGYGLAAVLACVGCAAAAMGESLDTPAHVDTSRPNAPIDYPTALQRRDAVGSVVIRVHVNADGKPIGAELLQSSGSSDLDLAATGGVLGWHYVPAMEGGEPVTDWAVVRVDFTMPPGAAPMAHPPVSWGHQPCHDGTCDAGAPH